MTILICQGFNFFKQLKGFWAEKAHLTTLVNCQLSIVNRLLQPDPILKRYFSTNLSFSV